MKRALPPLWRGRIALLAKTPEEFEARLPVLYLDIAHDGIILYDPTGYAAQKLARIRQLRLEAGPEIRDSGIRPTPAAFQTLLARKAR